MAGIKDVVDLFPYVLESNWILNPTKMDELSELVLPCQFHYHDLIFTLKEGVNLQKK